MALKSLRALASAIADVKKEAGDNAEHKSLLASLEGLSKEHGLDSTERDASEKRDSDDDDYSFATAEKRHVARNSEPAADSGGAAAASGGES